MPNDSRERGRKNKHHEEDETNDECDHRRKSSKRPKIRNESDVEEVANRRRHKPSSEVIDVHASSSEEGEDGSPSQSKRRHGRHKKHQKNDHDEKRGSTKVPDRKQTRRDNRSRSRSKSNEREARQESSVTVKVERSDDARRTVRSKNRNDRMEQRRSPSDRRRDGKGETRGNSREDRRYNDDRNNRDRRRGRPGSGGPSRHRGNERQDFDWGKSNNSPSNLKKEPTEKVKPDFKLSGKLTEERNTYKGVVIKYSEPPEARIPKKRWRLYQFKGDETLPTLYIHRQSAYLVGRDRKIADLPVDHPTCSKQHAALQYRLINYERPNGSVGKQIRLYVIDLESANGTFINGNKIEPKRYVELMEKDVVKFGLSSREYVLLHEQSKGDGSSSESGDDGPGE